MARFEMKRDGVLHVYPDGWQSNVGVYDGVDSIHFHNGCNILEVAYDGIEASTIVFDRIRGYSLYGCDYAVFRNATNVTWNASNIAHELSNLLLDEYNGDKQPALDHDISVRIVGGPYNRDVSFVLAKGTKKFVVDNIVSKYQYGTSSHYAVDWAYRCYIKPLDWIETYLALVDMEGDDDKTRQFVKRRIARSIKKYFDEADDLLVIRLIDEGLLTKPTMTALLDMANDSGRIDVVAAILDKVGGGGRKRFAI